MFFYISLFLIFFFSSIFNKNKITFFILVLTMILIASLRDLSVGLDTEVYSIIYGYIQNGQNNYRSEPIYRVINILSPNFRCVLFIMSILTVGITSYVLYKSTSNPHFSLFLFMAFTIYSNSLNIMRQSLAMSFLLLSFYYLSRNKFKVFIYFVFAFLSHNISLCAFPVYLFYRSRLFSNKKAIVFILIFSFIFGLLFFSPIMRLYNGPYSWYLYTDDMGFRGNNLFTSILAFLLTAFIVVFIIYGNEHVLEDKWLRVFIMGLVIINVTQTIVLGVRMSQFYTQVQVIFFVNYLSNKKKEKLFFLGIFILYVFLYFFVVFSRNSSGVFPYSIMTTIE